MANITDALIQQYQHPRIKLVVGGSTIYENDIVSGSFNYRGGVTGGGAFAPGGCVISSVSFTVHNRTGTYTNMFSEGTQIQVYIGYGATPETATYDLLCTVYASEVTKRNYKISVNAFDKLRDADKKKWTTFSFPMTVNQIISSAASEAGITVAQLPTAGGSISVDLRDDDGNQPELSMTCRQAIAQALLISGNFGYMTETGSLYCGWYSSSADVTVPTEWLLDYSISDSQDYTGVQVYGQTPTGSTTRLYVLSSGSFITENNCAAIQSRLYSALVGMNVFTANLSIVCNPNVRPGMLISLTYPQAGGTVSAIIPLMSVTIKGSLRATYTSESVTTDEADDLRGTDDPYATKDYVDDALKNASGKSKVIRIGLTGQAGTLATSDTFTGYVVSGSGISALDISSWTTEALKCYIMPQVVEVPTYSSISALLNATGDNVENYKFKLRLKVKVNTYVGWVDFWAYYTTAGVGKVIALNIPSGSSTQGYDQHGGTAVFTMAKPSTGAMTFVPFKLFGRTDQGYAFLYGVTDRDWYVSQTAPTV